MNWFGAYLHDATEIEQNGINTFLHKIWIESPSSTEIELDNVYQQ
jgi:hypothetical protein